MESRLFLHQEQISFIAVYYFSLVTYVVLFLNFFYILFSIVSTSASGLDLLKLITHNKFYFYSFLTTLLSLAGVPPFIGFFSKLLQFYLIFNNTSIIMFVLFGIFSTIMSYFYIQNFKYLVDNRKDAFKKHTVFIVAQNKKFHIFIICCNIFNFFGFLFIGVFVDLFSGLTLPNSI